MLIKDWMTKDVLTIDENTSLLKANRMMRDNTIRRLPVVSHGKLLGILTDRDIKDASPASSTTLDVHELYYLLSEMRVKEVMTKEPVSLSVDDTLEMAAQVMLINRISGLPILDDTGHLTGLLSESDVLRGFIHATGMQDGAVLYILELPDQAGATSQAVAIIRSHGAGLASILTSFDDAPSGSKRVAIRITGDTQALAAIHKEMVDSCPVIYHGIDNLQNIPIKK